MLAALYLASKIHQTRSLASSIFVFVDEVRVGGSGVLVFERHALGSPLNHLVGEPDVNS